MGKPVLMQRIIHVNGRPVHVIVFCVLSMAGPFIALYYGLWRSPNILLLWSTGQPPRGGGAVAPGKFSRTVRGCVYGPASGSRLTGTMLIIKDLPSVYNVHVYLHIG